MTSLERQIYLEWLRKPSLHDGETGAEYERRRAFGNAYEELAGELDVANEQVGVLRERNTRLAGEVAQLRERLLTAENQTRTYPTEAELSPEMRRRLLPRGLEWPSLGDGRPMMLGETVGTRGNGLNFQACAVEYSSANGRRIVMVKDAPDGDYTTATEAANIVRPPIVGKDGAAVEVGETVYGEDGVAWEVTGLLYDYSHHVLARRAGGGKPVERALRASWLTHENPMVAADGKPVEVGQELYSKYGIPYTVTGIKRNGKVAAKSEQTGFVGYVDLRSLTHENPEPEDSWEQLEEDAATQSACEFYGQDEGSCIDCPMHGVHVDCDEAKGRDIVRRAKKLAGVE